MRMAKGIKMRKALAMSRALFAAAVLIAGMALPGTSPARAVTLLSLTNTPTTTDTPYHLFFTAKSGTTTTTISIGGYDHPGFEYVFDISVTLGGGANLLGDTWVRTPAEAGSEATQGNGLLTFGDLSSGKFAVFSQSFTTAPGATYLLSFHFANSLDGSSFPSDPSQLLITTSAALSPTTVSVAVPELDTWTMALFGFVGLGIIGYCRRRKTQSRTLPA
jgi:hypothetical protein